MTKTASPDWIRERLVALARQIKMYMPEMRLEHYVQHLDDLTEPQLEFALQAARWKRIPLISEIRDLALKAPICHEPEDHSEEGPGEATQAWIWARNYARGKLNLLQVPERILYAMRRVGGPAQIRRTTDPERLARAFKNAFNEFPLHNPNEQPIIKTIQEKKS